MKDILLVCNYWHFEFEKKSSRYRTMADLLAEEDGFRVEVVTSTFRHQTKTQRNLLEIEKIPSTYEVTLLHEPNYRKNISLRRIYSHRCFAKGVVRYLNERKKPDIIICSVPSLSVGSAVTKYANKHNIKVIIDIQDLWPEAFKMAFHVPVISDILFFPMMMQANRIYARADRIMAVSDTYVKRALRYNTKDEIGLSVYIGTDSKLVCESVKGKHIDKPTDEFWIGYVGALGYSYAIKSIIDAIAILSHKEHANIVFKVMGDGVLLTEFKTYASQKNVSCDFTGFLEYGEMMSMLMVCDIAVNPIIGSSVSSIINKVSDYAVAGIPVVNTQNSTEYKQLIEEYNCGINCKNGDSQSIAEAIGRLYSDPSLKETMGNNSRRLAAEKFDRNNTYARVIKLIKDM